MEEGDNLDRFKVGSLPTVVYIPDFISDSDQVQLLNNINGAPLAKWVSLKNRRLQNWGGVVHEKGLLPQDCKSDAIVSIYNCCDIFSGYLSAALKLNQSVPSWLTKITQRICNESGLFPSDINHVLINEYCPNQGIMPHQDGPAYFPVVAILSLGSPAIMDFTPHSRLQVSQQNDKMPEIESDKWLDNHHPFSVLLMPRSLLIFKDQAYSDYLHGINDSEVQQCNGVVNKAEALQGYELDQPLTGLEKPAQVLTSGDTTYVHRATNRVSLTCRLVLKVRKNLFKF